KYGSKESLEFTVRVTREMAGRIMGIINHRYNTEHNENHARFCFMECYNDLELAKALIDYVENWAKEKGVVKLVGPLGFSDKDPQGFMIEGFDKPIIIATNPNLPYMPELITKLGFEKLRDLVDYEAPIPAEPPELYKRMAKRALNSGEFEVLEFTSKRKLKKWIRPVFRLVNETYSHIYGFAPYEDAEMDDFANRYLMVIDPRFVNVVISKKDNEVAAFIISMPDISEGIRKAKGKVIPFGIFKILRLQKKTKQLNLLLGAIKEKYRNRGLDAVMAVTLLNAAIKAGLEVIDSHVILADNLRMRAEMDRVGGKVYKKYRIYQRDIKN
ncbi:MAG: hypothetical protein GXO79_07170, partial [Chlorobi bacterium]|nr:hypothetical protein [Chlorobiota bacterium]